MNNKLQQLAALMRVTIAYVLGRTTDPTSDPSVDLDGLTDEEKKRLEGIASLSGQTLEQLLSRSEPTSTPTTATPTPTPTPTSPTPTTPTADHADSALRAAVRRFSALVQRALAELDASLAAGAPQPSPPNDGDPTTPPGPTTPAEPTNPDPSSPTDPNGDDMPILRPDSFHAHMRVAIDGDRITVEKATGLKKNAVRFADDAPEGNCQADSAYRTSLGLIYAGGSDKRPRNTRLVRMDLADDHKIDPSEVVVIVTAADRETAYRHDFDGFSVSDHSVDAVIRDPEPDTDRPKLQARFDVMLFRIG